MEIIKVIGKPYKENKALENVINYATNMGKTQGYIGGYGVNPCKPDQMIQQMYQVKNVCGKATGYRQLRHYIVSFEPVWEVTADMALHMAYEIARHYMGQYQICFGVHLDTKQIHIHFVMNTVSYIDGRLYSGSRKELEELKNHVHNVLRHNVPALNIMIDDL